MSRVESIYRDQFPDFFQLIDDDSVAVRYSPVMREFAILRPQHSSVQVIRFCPLSGKELPASLRDAFFDDVEARGLSTSDPDYRTKLPPTYQSEAWWREKGL